jgi:GNAT superfamily N-acetyltransferase
VNALAKHREEVEFFRDNPGKAFDESAPKIEFQTESWLDVLPELKAMFDAHWEEIALNRDAIKLDIDYDLYERLTRSGELHLVTARDDGWLVGYHVSVIRPHPHYKSTLHCLTDVFYLRPEYRSGMTGYKLIKFFRDSLKARGVKKVLMGTKLGIDIDPLMKRLGFTPIERVYSLVLP